MPIECRLIFLNSILKICTTVNFRWQISAPKYFGQTNLVVNLLYAFQLMLAVFATVLVQ